MRYSSAKRLDWQNLAHIICDGGVLYYVFHCTAIWQLFAMGCLLLLCHKYWKSVMAFLETAPLAKVDLKVIGVEYFPFKYVWTEFNVFQPQTKWVMNVLTDQMLHRANKMRYTWFARRSNWHLYVSWCCSRDLTSRFWEEWRLYKLSIDGWAGPCDGFL